MDEYALAKNFIDLNTPTTTDPDTGESVPGDPELMYVPGRGWYYWNEDKWNADTTGVITRLAADAIIRAEDKPNAGRIFAVIRLAQDLPGVTVSAADLDGNPYLLNTPSGHVDLRTSTHHLPSPHLRLTKSTTAPHAPTTGPPTRFLRFLEQVIPDPETRHFLQRAVGYSATGLTQEEVLFFLVGKGANGKTTLLHILRSVLGDYANTVPTSLLTSRYQASHDSDRLSLAGLRLAVANETDFGQQIAEAKVKSLVSTDAITARGAYEKTAATFMPTHHLWLSTNYLPSIDGSDDGLARRLIIIDFPTTFSRDERDPGLARQILRDEGSGVLNWIIEGAGLYLTDGLRPPISTQLAVDEYREDMDIFTTFIAENIELHPDGKATNPELWDAFTRWQASEPPNQRLGRREFGVAMKRHFRQSRRDGARYWPGLRLRSPQAPGTPPPERAPGQAERDALAAAGL